jgi:arginase family enzyme
VAAKELAMCDAGDLHVYPADMEKQARATAAEVHRLALDYDLVVLLGGEHSISFPAYAGVAAAVAARGEGTLGYLQIDHHFDFGDDSPLYGDLYQGSNARRISEIGKCGPAGQAFVGQGDLTNYEQHLALQRDGYILRTMEDIREAGFVTSLQEAVSAVLEAADRLYVSIDVDVCDASALPGTGNVTLGGISNAEFLNSAGVLRRLGSRLACVDVVEVAPRYDPSGVTAAAVARLLFEMLCLEDT